MKVALKRRYLGGFAECCCRLAENRRAPGADDQRDRFAGLGYPAPEYRPGRFRRRLTQSGTGPFVDRIGFAGQRGFVGSEGRSFDDQTVRPDDIACPHPNEVARHDHIDRNLNEYTVALRFGGQRHRPTQYVGGADCVTFLNRIESDRQDKNCCDDRSTDQIAGRAGNTGRCQQYQ